MIWITGQKNCIRYLRGNTIYMKTFKEYKETSAVSFDFDNTIFMLDWDDAEKDYSRDDAGDEIGHLNEEIAKAIKDYKVKGYKVYVITSRYAIWRGETEEYLADHNLMSYIDEVIFTNGSWKAATCKKNGVERHYDDDPEELRRLRYKGIEGILVKNEKMP